MKLLSRRFLPLPEGEREGVGVALPRNGKEGLAEDNGKPPHGPSLEKEEKSGFRLRGRNDKKRERLLRHYAIAPFLAMTICGLLAMTNTSAVPGL